MITITQNSKTLDPTKAFNVRYRNEDDQISRDMLANCAKIILSGSRTPITFNTLAERTETIIGTRFNVHDKKSYQGVVPKWRQRLSAVLQSTEFSSLVEYNSDDKTWKWVGNTPVVLIAS